MENNDVEELNTKDIKNYSRTNDICLEIFVNMVNNHSEIEFNITLFTNGQIISGTLIGYTKYIELVAEGIRSSGDEYNIIVGDAFGRLKELYIPKDSPNYIHLKDIHIRTPGDDNFKIKSMPLRLKFADVTGFIFGI